MPRRILRIWLPKPPETRGDVVISRRAAAIVGALFLAGSLTLMLFSTSGAATAIGFLLAITGIGCTVSAIRGKAQARAVVVAENEARRNARLNRIAAHAHASTRAPHRLLELQLRDAAAEQVTRTRIESALRRLEPGRVIIINGPRGCQTARPVPIDRAFEPIRLPDAEWTGQLIEWNLEAQGIFDLLIDDDEGRLAKRKGESQSPPEPLSRRLVAWLAAGAVVLVVLGCLGGTLFFLLKAVYAAVLGSFVAAAGLLGLLVIIAGPPLVRRPLLGRATYLVPGGVVVSAQAFWSRRAKFTYFQAAGTALVVDWPKNRGWVVSQERVHCVPMNWAGLAAWLSTARSPTDEEIASLLGGELD